MKQIIPYLHLARVSHWIKNGIIFVPLFFAGELWNAQKILAVALTAFAFCCVASTVYVFNDIVDYKQDQKHPTKKSRPLAAMALSQKKGIGVLITLLIIDILLLFILSRPIALMLLLYVFLNILYTFYLKHIPIIDILLIASFYVIRLVIGGFVARVPLSSWLIATTIFLALLLVVGKRRAELSHEIRRPVLAYYSQSYLDALLSIAAGLTVISYSLYILIVHSEPAAVYTIFFVLLGVMRFLLLIYNGRSMEFPEMIIWKDRVILFTLVGWIITMYGIFY